MKDVALTVSYASYCYVSCVMVCQDAGRVFSLTVSTHKFNSHLLFQIEGLESESQCLLYFNMPFEYLAIQGAGRIFPD